MCAPRALCGFTRPSRKAVSAAKGKPVSQRRAQRCFLTRATALRSLPLGVRREDAVCFPVWPSGRGLIHGAHARLTSTVFFKGKKVRAHTHTHTHTQKYTHTFIHTNSNTLTNIFTYLFIFLRILINPYTEGSEIP